MNDLEKIRDNELGTLGILTDQLREMESRKNKKLTVSISTILQTSEREIQQELDRYIRSEILERTVLSQEQTSRICDFTCEGIRKDLSVFAKGSDKTLVDRQKMMNRVLQVMEEKFKGSQKELNHPYKGWKRKSRVLRRILTRSPEICGIAQG